MATPAPIYVSSPGLLVSKNPATTQVVLIPPASTIASQLIVRDASGTASLANPIVVSTTHGALFTGGASTFYINSPYAAFATASLSPSLYMPLYASSFQPTFRYGTESNFTPQYQYISSAYNPASFNALSTTALYGTLVNGAPLFTTADPDFRFQAQSLSTGHLSTPDLTVDAQYTAGSATTTSSYSAYLSAGVGLLSTLTTDSMVVQGTTTLQSTLRTAGSLQVGGNFSMAGPAVFADVSANGYWSTLGTIGVGGDVSGATVNALTSTIVGGGAYSSGPYYVSAATVAATLSTVLASASTAVYSGGLGIGVAPGTALSATVDVSGGASVSAALTASGISTIVLSSATAVLSSATLRDVNTPYSAYDLKVQGGQLFVGGTPLGGGSNVSAEFVGNSFTLSNFLYGTSTITSTFTVGSTIVNPDFDVAVYGSAHSSTTQSTLFLAGGYASSPSFTLTVPSIRSSVKYSWDGLNWLPIVNGGAQICYDIAYNGRMWVGVFSAGNSGQYTGLNIRSTIQWSLDGSNWSNSITGGFLGFSNWGFGNTQEANSVAWNGRMWIATGTCCNISDFRCTIQYSFNGSNWSNCLSATSFATTTADNVAPFYGNRTYRPTWNGTMWIAGRGTANNTSNACYSFDGLNWSNLGIACGGGPIVSLGWNGRYWIAGSSNCISLSSNGFTWTSNNTAPISAMQHITDIKWDGIKWVAVGQSNVNSQGIIYSYNGLNWFSGSGTSFSGITGNTIVFVNGVPGIQSGARKAIWTGNVWYAVGGTSNANSSNASIEYSRNGINWSNVTSGGFGSNGYANAGNSISFTGQTIAWQSNINNDLIFGTGLNIEPQGQQLTFTSSASYIHSLSSIVSFNQTLFVDSSRQTAINTYYSSISTQYLFFVDGSMLTYGAAKQGGAATWTAVSDERVKQDIQDADISACYHAVRGLHVHNFKYKDTYIQKYKLPSKPRYGLYAEEVEQVIPEAVINTDVLGEQVKMLDMEPVNMLHYGATSYLYSTLKHHTSTIAGGHTYITAAGPLQDISGAFHTSYANRPALHSNLTELFTAHASNYQ